MSSPDLGPENPQYLESIPTDTPAPAEIFMEIIKRSDEIREAHNQPRQWEKNRSKAQLATPYGGNILTLDISGNFRQAVYLGHFDPRYASFEIYPELTEELAYFEDIPTLQFEAYKARGAEIRRFHASKAPDTRTVYDHPKIKELHLAHNIVFREYELDRAIELGLELHHSALPHEKLEIDEHTFLGVSLGSESVKGGEVPERVLNIRLLGAYYNLNGEKRRVGPQMFRVGMRLENEEMLFFEPAGTYELFDGEELNILTAMAQDLRDLRAELTRFDIATGGIELKASEDPGTQF